MSWAAGWLVTTNVIVDAENGYVAFGSSGALMATTVTGLVLRRIFGPQCSWQASWKAPIPCCSAGAQQSASWRHSSSSSA